MIGQTLGHYRIVEKIGSGAMSEVYRAQLAEGLAAAHEHGVIHRDLKPADLFVALDGRLKILDFGLAKLVYPELTVDVTQSISKDSRTICGTVPYMSPEQLRGQPVDARSDIYAAGAVLYEMATGRRPFPQTQSVELIEAILHQLPAPPALVNPHVALGVERSILKALEKDASQRHQSARELLAAFRGISSGVIEETTRRRTEPSRRVTMVAAGTALAIVVAVGLVLGLNVRGIRDRMFRRNRPEPIDRAMTASSPVHARRSVAVLGFKNLSGQPDKAWFSTALSEMLTTELAAGEQLRTVPGENVAQMKIDLSLPDADSYGTETLAKIRKNINADDVVLGSYIMLGKGQIRLDLRLQDAIKGETLDAISEKGSEGQIDDLVSRAGAELRKKLGAGTVSAAEATAVKSTLPSNPEAARLYSEGLAKIRAYDNLAARDLLQKAVATELNFALGYSALAAAWSGLGYDSKATEEAKKAHDLSANLSREDRLAIEGLYWETAHNWDKAIEVYRTLFGFFPDNLAYGLQLAGTQATGGKATQAMETIEALRKLPTPTRDDPRIDIAEATAADELGDYKRELEAAERAAAKATATGMRLLLARALHLKGFSSRRLLEFDVALAAEDQARQIYAAVGDRGAVASTLNTIANILNDEGDYSGARKMYQKALQIYAQIGRKSGVAAAKGNIATVLAIEGQPEAAKRMHEESLATYRELSLRKDEALELIGLGDVLRGEGDLAGANKMYESALAIFREVGNKAAALYALYRLGKVLWARDDLSTARQRFQEVLTLANKVGEKEIMSDAEIALAELAIADGHAAEAEPSIREAIAEYQADKLDGEEAYAQAVLARCLLADQKPVEAQKAIISAVQLAQNSKNRETWAHPDIRVAVTVDEAKLRAASGQPQDLVEALQSLEKILDEAKKSGLITDQFEIRLARGEVELKSDKKATGRARLATLEKDATARGFLLIARKAAAASK